MYANSSVYCVVCSVVCSAPFGVEWFAYMGVLVLYVMSLYASNNQERIVR